MPTEVERLVVNLEARIAKFDADMRKAAGIGEKQFRRIRKEASATEARLAKFGAGINKRIGAGIGGILAGFSLKEASDYIDSATRIQNALKSTGLEGEALRKVYDDLFAAAQRNSAPIEDLVNLYSRLSLSQKELNTTSTQLVGFTNTIAEVLRAGGTDVAGAKDALTQLAQALGGAKVQAEEFGSILDGAPSVARAAAAGIAEAGGSVAKLRALVNDGKVSSEAFFRAIQAGAPAITANLATAERTISGSFTNLYNSLTDLAGRFNTSSEATGTFGAAIDELAQNIARFDVGHTVSEIQRYIDRVNAAVQVTSDWVGWLSRASGLENVGEFVMRSAVLGGAMDAMGYRSSKVLRERMEGGGSYENAPSLDAYIRNRYGAKAQPASKGDRVETVSAGQPAQPTVKPIKLSDFPAVGDDKKGAKAKKPKRERKDDLERERDRTKEDIASIQAETLARSALNPLITDYGFTLAKARKEQELLSAATEAGTKLTPALRTEINELATSYATATADAARLEEAQDLVFRAAQDAANLGRDVLGGFIDDLKSGASWADTFANALTRIGDRLLDGALDSLFSVGGKGAPNIFAGLASLFGGGRATGGAVRAGKFYEIGEKGPELFAPGKSGTIIPNHNLPNVAMAAPEVRPAAVSSTFAPTFHMDLRGASPGVGPEVQDAIAQALRQNNRERDRTLGARLANGRQQNRAGFR